MLHFVSVQLHYVNMAYVVKDKNVSCHLVFLLVTLNSLVYSAERFSRKINNSA